MRAQQLPNFGGVVLREQASATRTGARSACDAPARREALTAQRLGLDASGRAAADGVVAACTRPGSLSLARMLETSLFAVRGLMLKASPISSVLQSPGDQAQILDSHRGDISRLLRTRHLARWRPAQARSTTSAARDREPSGTLSRPAHTATTAWSRRS